MKAGRVTLATTPPRGMRDVLPDEVELRDAAVQQIVTVYRSYGFRRIETPALEGLPLLIGSEGGDNEKLIFKVLKRGEDLDAALRAGERELADLGLRYDLTVPLARYYAENHASLPDPLKAIQIGPVWRAERPQKGRFRQFTQCDIDVLGVASPVVEIELILATSQALAQLGLSDLTVRINDRRLLALIARHCGIAETAQGGFFIVFDKLDKIGADGVVRELSEAGHDASAVARFEQLLPTLQKGEAAFEALRAALGADAGEAFDWLATIIRTANGDLPAGTRVAFDPTLVRGMGYYTGTIFEISSPAFPSSIAGGGRYDRMVGKLLGRDVPACGFSIGFERLILILSDRASAVPSDRAGAVAPSAAATAAPRRVALVVDGHADLTGSLAAARGLRNEGYMVSVELRRKNFGKQLEDFVRHGFWGFAAPDAAGAIAVKPLTGTRERG
jgi:histidyl-tRNA synthetase